MLLEMECLRAPPSTGSPDTVEHFLRGRRRVNGACFMRVQRPCSRLEAASFPGSRPPLYPARGRLFTQLESALLPGSRPPLYPARGRLFTRLVGEPFELPAGPPRGFFSLGRREAAVPWAAALSRCRPLNFGPRKVCFGRLFGRCIPSAVAVLRMCLLAYWPDHGHRGALLA